MFAYYHLLQYAVYGNNVLTMVHWYSGGIERSGMCTHVCALSAKID